MSATVAGSAAGPVGTAIGGAIDAVGALFGVGLVKTKTPDNPNFDAQLQQLLAAGALPPGTTIDWLRKEGLAIRHRKDWAPETLENISKIAWGHWYEQRGDQAGLALVRATPAGQFFVGPSMAASHVDANVQAAQAKAAREAGWSLVDPNEDAQFATRYRTWFWMPDYSAGAVPAIKGALATAKAAGTAFHSTVRITGWEVFTPETSPKHPDVDAPRGAYVVRIGWEKHGGGTPVHVLLAVIAVIITAVAGWVIVAKVTEKQLKDLGGGIGDVLANLLSPGMVIAAMVAVVVLARRNR